MNKKALAVAAAAFIIGLAAIATPALAAMVTQADLETNTASVAKTNGSGKWFMYNDSTDVIDNTLGSFVTGPAGITSTGSIEFTLAANPNDRKNVATYQFAGTALSAISSLGYASYSHSGAGISANEAPFFNINADFNGSDTWQKRLVFLPSDNGAVVQDAWSSYDAINGGAALWRYSGATWPASTTPATTPLSWNTILASYPGIRVLPSDGWFGVRVGEPGPSGYTADIDSVSVNGTTYDFEPTPTTSSSQTVTVSGNTSAGENQLGWLFNRDTTTQTPFEFAAGTSSIGTGSLYVAPISNTLNGGNDKFIGELFMLAPISDIDSISYDFQIASGTPASKDQFYMSVYANFGESAPTKFYDCRYDVIPATGSLSAFTTVTFDPSLTYSVTTRGGTTPSPHACPASPAAMQALSASGTSTIRVFALNVGDSSTSDQGVAGNLDNVKVVTTANFNTDTTTYDFEPVAAPAPTPSSGGSSRRSGSGGGRVETNTGGEVLGAETGPEECSTPLFTTYMSMGAQNDSIQVKLLQSFLNVEVGSTLPITGYFGVQTDAAVKAFQAKYAAEVLSPWGLTSPTGWVYKFTQRKMNLITCSALNIPVPTAVIDAGDAQN